MKKTIKDYSYKGKKVIVRQDLNVPIENGVITDTTRITASIKTINYLIKEDAKIIILSHLGKIKSEEDKKNNTLYPVYLKLKELLPTNVYFSKEPVGKNLENSISKLKNGEVLLVENTRYMDFPDKLESNCDELLGNYWSTLADIFINDAYGTCHRSHASNVGISKNINSAIGFLVEEEITKIDEIMNEQTHPFTVIMGGKKISDKIPVINNLVEKCDTILVGGGMCYTFLKALNYEVGNSIVDEENIEFCKEILKKYPNKIVLPKDIITQDEKNVDINNINPNDIGYDIGTKTIELFKNYIKNSKRIVINGPMGVFEDKRFQKGTKELYECIKQNKIKTLVGGGDSAASVNLLGYKDAFYHISTGGGATLEYLSGNNLQAIDIIEDK